MYPFNYFPNSHQWPGHHSKYIAAPTQKKESAQRVSPSEQQAQSQPNPTDQSILLSNDIENSRKNGTPNDSEFDFIPLNLYKLHEEAISKLQV